ncbi:MAG: hypothetical protein AB8B84_06250 [Granulosicoccus sp.]
MVAFSLLGKDIREHWMPVLFLTFGCVVVFLLLLIQNKQAAYSMSSLEIVRYALLYLMPVVALILGNRLIVGEYLSGTRLFVEALPLGPNLPLILKYLLGLVFLSGLALVMIALAAKSASAADEITSQYLLLLAGKTLVMMWLYWSIVFCFSLCGYLRVLLYLVLALTVAALLFYPGIDADKIPPFALMDEQLFVFERDIVPWFDILGTAVLAMVFTAFGFILTKLGEGSVLERLSKPMTRRDFVAISVLMTAGIAVWSTVAENTAIEPIQFSSKQVLRSSDPVLSVLYLSERYRDSADAYMQRISDSLIAMQASLGLNSLPDVKLALAPNRDKFDIEYMTSAGVFVAANWLEHDSYDDAVLDAVILHGVLSAQTNGRALIEPYHWVLDGFTRWWAEQSHIDSNDEHAAELLARAIWVLDVDPRAKELVNRWQLTADRFAYPSAEALAWSAMYYIEQAKGRDVVIALANEFLTLPLSSTVLASIKDRRTSPVNRMEKILGTDMSIFLDEWVSWLTEQQKNPEILAYFESLPALSGNVTSAFDDEGVHTLIASYEVRESSLPLLTNLSDMSGQCVLKHENIGPFDTEFDLADDYKDIAFCQTLLPAHRIESFYASGDRAIVALEYEGEKFHQPLRIHTERMDIQ